MPDHLLDVHLDINPLELADEPDPTRAVYEMSRKAAEDRAAEAGRRLRHPDPRETVVKEATHPVTSQPVLLVSTRWSCD